MTAEIPRTEQLQACLHRLHAGDASARDELFRHACDRLERLTRRMLTNFPGVHRWVQTDDVLQNALVRLLRALEAVQPTTTREFFALSATQIRRELHDLARHFYGPQGLGAQHATNADDGESDAAAYDRPQNHSDLVGWSEFHQQVAQLADEEREVMDLLFYQGLKQTEAASLLNVNVRTIQRRWQSALLTLHQKLQGHWPGL